MNSLDMLSRCDSCIPSSFETLISHHECSCRLTVSAALFIRPWRACLEQLAAPDYAGVSCFLFRSLFKFCFILRRRTADVPVPDGHPSSKAATERPFCDGQGLPSDCTDRFCDATARSGQSERGPRSSCAPALTVSKSSFDLAAELCSERYIMTA